jgi:putative glutamine amidotransferase
VTSGAVGVVGHGYVVLKRFGTLPVTGTPRWYLDALAAAGARPVLLPGAAARNDRRRRGFGQTG